MAQLETCANCGAQIGKLETPHLWREQIVCAPCCRRLVAANDLPNVMPEQVAGGLGAADALAAGPDDSATPLQRSAYSRPLAARAQAMPPNAPSPRKSLRYLPIIAIAVAIGAAVVAYIML